MCVYLTNEYKQNAFKWKLWLFFLTLKYAIMKMSVIITYNYIFYINVRYKS